MDRPLRPYQIEACDAIDREWAHVRSTMLVLATGLGKTRVGSEVIRRRLVSGTGRVLWVAHRDELITQARDAISENIPGVRVGIEKAGQYANTYALHDMHDEVVVASVQTLHEKRRQRFAQHLFGTVIIDECFPAGTMVGNKRIEDIRAGDTIRSYDEATGTITESVVSAQWSKEPSCMVRFVTSRGTVVCTANHPILTRGGWMAAGMLAECDEVAYDEAFDVRCVRSGNGDAGEAHLASDQVCRVQGECAAGTIDAEGMGRPVCDLRRFDDAYGEARHCGTVKGPSMLQRVMHEGPCQFRIVGPHGSYESKVCIGANEAEQPNETGRFAYEDVRNSPEERSRTEGARREWERTDGPSGGVDLRARGRMGHGASGQYEDARTGVPALLQGRHRSPGADDRRGDRWGVTPGVGTSCAGRAEGSVPTWVRVDSVSFLERGSDGTFGGVCPDGLVYNLEVAGTHTYTANGFVVHNCHHSVARSYRSIIDHFPDAKILGLTATPDRGDGVGMGEVAESVAYEMGIQRGIESGFLCPIKVLAINVHGLDLSSVKTTAGDLNQGQLARILESDEVHHEIASPLAEHIGTRQAVVFCASVAQSKALADVIQGYMPSAQIRHVDGSTPEMERRRILGEYARGEAQVICNCAVLTEGFDAPNTSLIALARPTKSRALYAQMVGRGTRLAPGKSDCIVLDFRGNAGRHSLANPADLLAGKPLSDDVRKELAKRERDGKVLDLDAIAEAEEEVAKRIREEEARRARQAAIRVKAQYAVARMDAFYSEFEPPNRSHDTRPATDRQVAGLEKFGIDRDKAERMTFRQASDTLDRLTTRAREGLATYKQSRWLAKQGIRFDIPKSVAAKIMDAAANDHWRVPQWAREKYGVRA